MTSLIRNKLQGDTMTKWAISCAKCECNEFKNEKNQYIMTSDIDNPHGEMIVTAECVKCGHVQCVV